MADVEHDEITALRMENDLLAHEARVLRARAKELELELEQLEFDKNDAVHLRNMASLDAQTTREALAETREELAAARDDLTRLLRRLGSGPLGWAMRRRKGYVALRDRWLP